MRVDPERFDLIERVDGHTWVKAKGSDLLTGYAFCLRCGYVRRADKSNKPCRGRTRITMRGGEGDR